MKQYVVTETAVIDAPPAQVYALLADYHEGHPAILPARYFTRLTVTAGGHGAGTVADVAMNVFGAKALYHLVVAEPEPGRVLMETDEAAGVVTTFTVDPVDDGARARVTITTRAPAGSGLKGLLQTRITAAITRKIYREELQQLARVVQERRQKPAAA